MMPMRPVRDPSLAMNYPAEQKAWCLQAVDRGVYPSHILCNQAVAAGAPMTDLTQTQAPPGSEAAFSKTKLIVGIGIAVVVVGIGAYLITK
jgi:hypothetical protein